MAVYTVNQLITKAYYLAGITARGLETVSDMQLNDGLERLNAFLAIKNADNGLIPFFQEYLFDGVPGVEKYLIPNLLVQQTLTFTIPGSPSNSTVRYSMKYVERDIYFSTSRADGVQSLPFQWHVERENGGMFLYMYFLPQQTLSMKLWGKFNLSSVALNQDLNAIPLSSPSGLISDAFYHEFMLYGLAEYLCEYYNLIPPPSVAKRFMQYTQILRDQSPIDLTMNKTSFFSGGAAFNYADVNIGRGWRPN